MIGPISPREAEQKKKEDIPEFVYEAFNELISENLKNGKYATVMQKDVVARIKKKGGIRNTQMIFDKGWLDVEKAYEKARWKVEYDKPGFNESYEASFRFTKKQK
jgi:hypothetical protein